MPNLPSSIAQMRPGFVLFILTFNLWLQGYSRPVFDTLKVTQEFDQQAIKPYLKVVISTPDLQAAQFLHLLSNSDTLRWIEKTHTFGFSPHIYWATFVIENTDEAAHSLFLKVANPHLYEVKLFAANASGDLLDLGSVSNLRHFRERPVENRNPVFDFVLPAGETYMVFARIDRHNHSVNFELTLWEASAFAADDAQLDMVYGGYLGFIALCVFFALLSWLFLRQYIFLWYLLYLLGIGFTVFSALGFSAQFIYPGWGTMHEIFLRASIIFFLISFIRFSQELLESKVIFPFWHKIMNGLAVLLCLFLAVVLVFPEFYKANSLLFLNAIYITALVSGVTIIGLPIKALRHQRNTAIMYIIGLGSVILGGFTVIFMEYGFLPGMFYWVHPLVVGSAIEIIIFSLLVTNRIKMIYDQRNELSLRIARQQKQMLRAYVEGVEKERERIAQELHDDIGSRLRYLKNIALLSNQSGEFLREFDALSDEIRSLSHRMIPAVFNMVGFRRSIENLAKVINQQESVSVKARFFDFDDNLDDVYAAHIFRIVQEAITNVQKHAEATQMDIQFFGYEEELVVTIDDNGNGFDAQQPQEKWGIGLKTMKNRVNEMGGEFEISSSPGKGTHILIKTPRILKPAEVLLQES